MRTDVTTRRKAEPPAMPPSHREVEIAVTRVQALRHDITAAHFIPSQDFLRRMDEIIADESSTAKVVAAAAPGRPEEVKAYLGYLALIFPNSGQVDAKIAGMFMADDVLSLEPSAAAVEIACRKWRQTQKFLPAISEIMAAIRMEQDALQASVDFLKKLPETRDRMRRDLDRG